MNRTKASDKSAGSWVATCLVSGRVWELFDREDAKASEGACLVETIHDYLARINEGVRDA